MILRSILSLAMAAALLVPRRMRSEHDAAAQARHLCPDADLVQTEPQPGRCRRVSSPKAMLNGQKRRKTRLRSMPHCCRAASSALVFSARPATASPVTATASSSRTAFPILRPISKIGSLAAPAQHFYDVMTNGYGVMFSYADRVSIRTIAGRLPLTSARCNCRGAQSSPTSPMPRSTCDERSDVSPRIPAIIGCRECSRWPRW